MCPEGRHVDAVIAVAPGCDRRIFVEDVGVVQPEQHIVRRLPVERCLQGILSAADDALVASINDYRLAPEGCAGRQPTSLGPLAPNDRLARQRVTSAEQVQSALQQAGYQPAAAQVIAVSGPALARRDSGEEPSACRLFMRGW